MAGTGSGGERRRRALATALLVGLLALLYAAWMTGGSFRFPELERFPNHRMLARAFAHGRLAISEAPRVDVVPFEGRRYLYFGPVPAAIRTPLELLGIDPPTGLVVCLLAAVVVGLFAALLRELAAGRRELRALERVFLVAFAANGLTLFMVWLPSVHHESILWAVLFLLAALLVLLAALRAGPSPRRGWLLGTTAALAVGSRFSYLPAAALLVAVFVIAAACRARRRRLAAAALAAAVPLVLMLGLLMLYNQARFRSPFDFGLANLTSRYQDYIREGHFWRLDHVPYNLWDYLARPPQPTSRFPYLKADIVMSEVTRRSATPEPPYRLVHVDELAVSVFLLLPLAALAVAVLGCPRAAAGGPRWGPAALLAVLAAVQLGVLSLTFASTARYMFDFAPLLLLLAFLGAVAAGERRPRATGLAAAGLALLTLLVSLLLPFSAARQYGPFLGYWGPLSGRWERPR